jgi:hypothetical protein
MNIFGDGDRLVQRIVNGGIEHLQARLEIALQMHAQRAAAALGEHIEITACLRGLDDSKACLLARHREILGIV